jgi:hypothetical protein
MKNTSNVNFLDASLYQVSQPERGLQKFFRRLSRQAEEEPLVAKSDNDLKIQKYLDQLRDYGP